MSNILGGIPIGRTLKKFKVYKSRSKNANCWSRRNFNNIKQLMEQELMELNKTKF